MLTPVRLRRWSARLRATVIATPLLAVAATPAVPRPHLGPVPPAPLHLHLLKSDPASGASLASAPGEIRLIFSGPVTLASMAVRDTSGQRITLSPAKISVDSLFAIGSGPDSVVENAGVAVFVIKQRLKPNSYQVTWKATGRDGHPAEDQFVFTVGAAKSDSTAKAKGQKSTGRANHGAHKGS